MISGLTLAIIEQLISHEGCEKCVQVLSDSSLSLAIHRAGEVGQQKGEGIHREERASTQFSIKLKKFKELSQLTNKDMMQRFIKNMTGEPFESEAVQKEKERLKSLFDFLEEVKKEGESRNGISKR